jgi:outer membrane immunogenic protein
MRTIHVFFCAAILAFATTVSAGGPKEIAPVPPPEEPFSWSGLYLGFNVGVVWEHVDFGAHDTIVDLDEQFDVVDPNDNFSQDIPFNLLFTTPGHSNTDTAPIAGGQIGFLEQFGHFVVGVEGGFSGTRTINRSTFRDTASGSTGIDSVTFDTDFTSKRTVETNWNGYIGGQLGFAWRRLLFYGAGGAAFTNVDVTTFDMADTEFFEGIVGGPVGPKQIIGSLGSAVTRRRHPANDVQTGWYAGGGLQYALTNFISAGLEYRHCDFGDETYTFGSADPLFQGRTNVSLDSDQLTFRVNILLGHMGR